MLSRREGVHERRGAVLHPGVELQTVEKLRASCCWVLMAVVLAMHVVVVAAALVAATASRGRASNRPGFFITYIQLIQLKRTRGVSKN